MNEVIFKTVTFVENGDILHGHYFYDSPTDSDYGHINGTHQLTISKAVAIMKNNGIDTLKNAKITISVNYW